MIIQSENMNMGAARTYNSARYDYARQTAWNDFGSTVLSMEMRDAETKHVSEISGDWQKQKGEGQKNRGGMTNDTMKDLMEQMNQTKGVRMGSLQENVRLFRQVRLQSLDYLLYMLFGKKPPEDILGSESRLNPDMNSESGAGGEYYSCFYYSENETTCFDAMGTVVTADGREHSFSISLEMSRSFTEMAETQVDFGKPRLCDPLVINLNCSTANVSDQKFYFDIDGDQEKESVSMLSEGSGYLALDANGDGEINDGGELFGTKSGNGFKDLMEYDLDKNGWIDEADDIFSKLKIWTKDMNGNDELISLKQAGVGAIYLGHENTEFSLNSMSDNSTNAVIRKTGIFLYENGEAGTVQQLDLAT